MAKWVGRMATDWENMKQGTNTNLRLYRCSDNLNVGATNGPAQRFGMHLEIVCLVF